MFPSRGKKETQTMLGNKLQKMFTRFTRKKRSHKKKEHKPWHAGEQTEPRW